MLEADNGTTSASGLGLEDVLQPVVEDMEESSAHSTVVTVADEVAQVATPSAQPATAATPIGSPTVPAASLQSFIASLKLPLEEPLIASSPRRRVSRLDDSVFVPRRSDRLAAKSIHRDPNPEKQAKCVLVNKWRHEPANRSQTPDPAIAAKFHETFAGPLSASKQAAMRELFPMGAAFRLQAGRHA
jgi:hypothetical protein